MKTKYIRNQFKFIVFHNSCQHRETAIKGFGPDKLIHGAGFVRFDVVDGKIQADCYGHSESLNKGPRHDDPEKLINALGINSDVGDAKYVIWRGKVVVFSHELDHTTIASASFMERTDCESAGFVKFDVNEQGKVVISCYGDNVMPGISAKPDDYKDIAHLLEFPEDTFVINDTPKLKM